MLKSEQQKTAHIQKLAIDKKSTYFVQSFWNCVLFFVAQTLVNAAKELHFSTKSLKVKIVVFLKKPQHL